METVSNVQELIRVIGVNCSNSPGESVSVKIKIWDDRVVEGSNYKGSEGADVISISTPCVDSNLLRSHVGSLLIRGKSFIVRNGQTDAFEWTIDNNQK